MFNKIFSKSRLKLLSVLLFVGVFNLSILAAVLPSIVSAAVPVDPPGISRFSEDFYTKNTVPQEAAIWSSVQLIKSGKCGALFLSGPDGSVTPADIVAGKWYLDLGSKPIGYHVEPGDGRLDCSNENSWLSDLLNAAGYSGRYNVLADKIKSSPDTKQALLDELSMAFFGRKNVFNSDPPAYLTYHIFLRNFTSSNACNAKVLTTPDQAVGKAKVTIQVFDASTNAVNPVDYVYTAKPGDVKPVGYGLPGDGDNDGEMQCRSMASQLQNAAFADDMLAYVALTGDTTGSNPLGTGDSEPSCENNGVLNWIMCPVISMLDGVISFLDSQIQERLIIKDTTYNNDQIKQIWSVMRNIAFMLLVPIMLVMVIGTALEFGPFDAYTVKKALPRMFVAVIFIALSLPICQFFIELANIAGTGIFGLMTAPFENVPITLSSLYGSAGAVGVTAIGAGALFAGIAAGAVSTMIVLSFAFTTFLALLVAYLVLLLRELVIILLIVLAPLAILVWIFPGNDKPWKLWKGAFTNLLIMFPLIMALIASGRILAEVIDTTQGDAAAFFLKLTAFIAPYFFIPATFKVAGGLFATVAGIANDKSRGVFDRQKKLRQDQRVAGRERAKAGKRLAGGTEDNFRGKLNRGIASTLTAPSSITRSGNTFKPSEWRSSTRAGLQSRNMSEVERNMKENQDYQSWMHDDGLNKAASRTKNASELRNYLVEHGGYTAGSNDLNDAVVLVESVRRSMSPDAFKAMTVRQALAGGTAHKSSSEPGAVKTAAGEAWADVARATVNDGAMAASLVANGRSDGMKAGRIDYAGAGFGTTLSVVNRMREELRTTGTISQQTIESSTREIHADVYGSQGGGSLVHSSMKPDAVKEMAPQMINDVEIARSTGSEREFTQSLASLDAVYNGLQGSSPTKAKIMADEVFSRKIEVSSLTPEMRTRLSIEDGAPAGATITYQQTLDRLRGNAEFKEMSRQYGNEIDRQMGQQAPDPSSTPMSRPGS